jgi:hypothetical protein
MIDDRDDIKHLLKARIESLCQVLLPDGRREGRLWVAHNPVTCDFDRSPEFKVALNKDIGAWKDWRSGDKGDVIGLVLYCRGTDFKGAMAWSRDWLGINRMNRAERETLERQAAQAKRAAAFRAEKTRLDRMGRAERLWSEGLADGAGSVAEALGRAYFAARKCPLEPIENRDRATFRFSAATEYWRRRETRFDQATGRLTILRKGPELPAIHSAMRAPAGQVTAVHCTFLDPLKPAKAALGEGCSAKLMFGEAKGSMIRISHGPEGEPPETAVEPHPLILCEGIEDGLSLAGSIAEARVWAAGSLSMMAHAPVWLPCVSAVIVARDNDWGKRQAERQFDAVLEALAGSGKPISVIASHVGKDFNDLATGEDA